MKRTPNAMTAPNAFLRAGAPCRIWTRCLKVNRGTPLPATVIRQVDASHWEVERCGLRATYSDAELLPAEGE